MSKLDNPVDSPAEWLQGHLNEYVESGGRKGHEWQGVHTLLLTTVGRRSGQARRTPLIYGQDGERYLVVASNGGAPGHPAWYHNLTANPRVRVQVVDEVFDATARTATEAEKPALWETMAQIWPAYNEYQTKTDRPIPVVILERI